MILTKLITSEYRSGTFFCWWMHMPDTPGTPEFGYNVGQDGDDFLGGFLCRDEMAVISIDDNRGGKENPVELYHLEATTERWDDLTPSKCIEVFQWYLSRYMDPGKQLNLFQ